MTRPGIGYGGVSSRLGAGFVEGFANQSLLCQRCRVRDDIDRVETDAGCTHHAIRHREHGCPVDDRKVNGFPESKFGKGALARRQWNMNLGHDLIFVQNRRFTLVNTEKIAHIDDTLGGLYSSLQCNEGRRGIARVHGDAALFHASTKDRVVAVIAFEGVTKPPALSETGKTIIWAAIIPAPDVLA